jgi:branched-chain amino acid transport system permease protein
MGMIVRAAVQYPAMAAALGYNVSAVFSGLFAIGAGLAGLAGAVGGAFYSTNPNMAAELSVIVFVVVVVGGLGSLGGAFAASLIIGVLASATVYVDASMGDAVYALGLVAARPTAGLLAIPLSATAGVVPYALMLLVLLIRPSGLAGEERG